MAQDNSLAESECSVTSRPLGVCCHLKLHCRNPQSGIMENGLIYVSFPRCSYTLLLFYGRMTFSLCASYLEGSGVRSEIARSPLCVLSPQECVGDDERVLRSVLFNNAQRKVKENG